MEEEPEENKQENINHIFSSDSKNLNQVNNVFKYLHSKSPNDPSRKSSSKIFGTENMNNCSNSISDSLSNNSNTPNSNKNINKDIDVNEIHNSNYYRGENKKELVKEKMNIKLIKTNQLSLASNHRKIRAIYLQTKI